MKISQDYFTWELDYGQDNTFIMGSGFKIFN